MNYQRRKLVVFFIEINHRKKTINEQKKTLGKSIWN